MIAEIVSVGTELLMGQIVNTDASFIASRLASLGFVSYYQTVVGDNRARLKETVLRALERADIVLFTGGLGPTDDDLTKETVAEALGLTCELIPEEADKLRAWFASRGCEMAPNNLKQVCFPQGSIILPNPNGTAPGCIMEKDGKAAILMPGPPRELFPMFTDSVMPYLEKKSGFKLYSKTPVIFGMGESDVTYRLRDLISAQTNPTIAPYIRVNEVTLRVTAQCACDEEGERLVTPVVAAIRERLGDVVYSEKDETLQKVCVDRLLERGETLAAAESCTGGLIAASVVEVPGCSDCFIEGCVTYANDAKMHRLGVTEATLAAHGAVSPECAREMAEGMRLSARTDYALASTGIAGPGGGTAEKPVGLVYVALASKEGTFVKELRLSGDRARIRHAATLNALDLLRRALYGLPQRT